MPQRNTSYKVPLYSEIDQYKDRPLGFSEIALKKVFTEEVFEEFKTWMRGQTMGMEGGVPTYYITDIRRFCGLNR